jgi:DNA-binding ferritin-like protein
MLAAVTTRDLEITLAGLLAETRTLARQTRLFHQNANGPLVQALCDLFERQYGELERGAAKVAARMEALGYDLPLSPDIRLDETRDTSAMIRTLADGHARAAAAAAEVLQAAREAGDRPTADLGLSRADVHQRTAAMYRVVQRFQPSGQQEEKK